MALAVGGAAGCAPTGVVFLAGGARPRLAADGAAQAAFVAAIAFASAFAVVCTRCLVFARPQASRHALALVVGDAARASRRRAAVGAAWPGTGKVGGAARGVALRLAVLACRHGRRRASHPQEHKDNHHG